MEWLLLPAGYVLGWLLGRHRGYGLGLRAPQGKRSKAARADARRAERELQADTRPRIRTAQTERYATEQRSTRVGG